MKTQDTHNKTQGGEGDDAEGGVEEEGGWFSELLKEKVSQIPASNSFVHLEIHDVIDGENRVIVEPEAGVDLR